MDVNVTKAAAQAEQLGRMVEGMLTVAEVAKNINRVYETKKEVETRIEQLNEDCTEAAKELGELKEQISILRNAYEDLDNKVRMAKAFLQSVKEREDALVIQAKEEANRVLVEAESKRKDVLNRLSKEQSVAEKELKNIVASKVREERALAEAKNKLAQFKESLV